MAPHLREEYEHLCLFADRLTFKEQSAAYPFAGYVLNINVCTKIHQDLMDAKICVVIALGDFEGGELVLEEPGIVINLKNGEGVAFNSRRITHLNLLYRGTRMSLVLHSDKQGIQFVSVDKHGWALHPAANFSSVPPEV